MQLAAVHGGRFESVGLQDIRILIGIGRHGESEEQGYRFVVSARRMSAAILYVTALAGVCVEQWPQAIAGIRAGRGFDPGVAEETVADTEIQAPGHGQVSLGQGIGIVIELIHGAFAPGLDRRLDRIRVLGSGHGEGRCYGHSRRQGQQ